MNKLNFNQSVGFPFETNILDEMQKAWTVLNALGAISGNFSIISGATTEGTTVADGVVFINGEVLEFKGGTVQANVVIVETIQSLEFEDLNTHEVIYTRYVTFGTATEQWPWENFKRPIPTKDLAALFTGIANQLSVIVEKLDTIQTGAQIQQPTDWNAVTGVTRLINKPDIGNPFLLKGVYSIGDVNSSDNIRPINLASAVDNANYMVIGSLVSMGSNYNIDNDVMVVIRDRTTTSFKIGLREGSGVIQDLDFHYVLIQL